MAKASSQKFIARNRAPRVQIEYDVELYGAEKKIQLPFVMGVLADLSGKPAEPLAPVADRKFLDIDVDNFDSRMKAMKPRAAFQVPNTLTGEGNINVELTFESMDDFSPAAVARKVDALNKLLEAQRAAGEPDYLHGRQDGRGGAREQAAAGSGAPADAGDDQEAAGRTLVMNRVNRSSGEQPWLTPNPSRTRSRRSEPSKSTEFDSLLQKGIQAEDRRGQGGGRAGRPDAGRAGAVADQADRRRRRQVDRGDHRRSSTRS